MVAATPFALQGVQRSQDLLRILRLPRRTWEPSESYAAELSKALRLPGGMQTFRPVQAQALYEIWRYGKLFGPIGTGEGKTLISALAPLMRAKRKPLLFVPAKLVEKTKRAFGELARHWPIPNYTWILSYEMLSHPKHYNILFDHCPDMIFLDEAHRAKNKKAAVTKRLIEYKTKCPWCEYFVTTGTISNRSITEYSHQLHWTHGEFAPVPISAGDLAQWAEAIDDRDTNRAPGQLRMLMTPEEQSSPYELTAVRTAFRRRIVETPGVVATSESSVGASLFIDMHDVDPGVDEDVWALLRSKWCRPDGVEYDDGMQVWRIARQLSVGFYYKWDPEPPSEWVIRRKEWMEWSRYLLSNNRRGLDSPARVAQAVDAGHYPDAEKALRDWRAVKNEFDPDEAKTPVWLSTKILDWCASWAKQGPGLIFVPWIDFAKELSRRTGLPYYGQGGIDTKTGRHIPEFGEQGSGEGVLICSQQSNLEGRNLQAWSRACVINPPPNGLQNEQLLARLHRPGQREDEVTFDYLVNSTEQYNAVEVSERIAQYQEATSGQPQKLLYADKNYPKWGRGFRWIERE